MVDLSQFVDERTVIGVCPVDRLNTLRIKVEAYQKGYAKTPADYIHTSKSVVVVGNAVDLTEDVYSKKFFNSTYPGYGRVFSLGKKIEEHLKMNGYKAKVARSLSAKNAAYDAGIGVWGKHSLIIHPIHGSRLRLDCVVTDWVPDKYNVPMDEDYCSNCNACLESCPYNCLKPYKVDAKRCFNKYMTKEDREKIIPMCPICQKSCHYNRE
jgi:NAD-dependent dihydropyrimidine dehydrogenase PreA subunit